LQEHRHRSTGLPDHDLGAERRVVRGSPPGARPPAGVQRAQPPAGASGVAEGGSPL